MIEVNTDPTPREVRVFGLLWLVFFAAVGAVALWRPQGLAGASVFLGLAWLGSLAFERAAGARRLAGVTIPALFGGVALALRAGVPPRGLALGLGAVGAAGALGIWAAPRLGRRLYVGWMLAAAPLGWSISRVVLAIVYYVVLTPVGLALRAAGRDPLRRRFDAAATSYWIERPGMRDPRRAFRQF